MHNPRLGTDLLLRSCPSSKAWFCLAQDKGARSLRELPQSSLLRIPAQGGLCPGGAGLRAGLGSARRRQITPLHPLGSIHPGVCCLASEMVIAAIMKYPEIIVTPCLAHSRDWRERQELGWDKGNLSLGLLPRTPSPQPQSPGGHTPEDIPGPRHDKNKSCPEYKDWAPPAPSPPPHCVLCVYAESQHLTWWGPAGSEPQGSGHRPQQGRMGKAVVG